MNLVMVTASGFDNNCAVTDHLLYYCSIIFKECNVAKNNEVLESFKF